MTLPPLVFPAKPNVFVIFQRQILIRYVLLHLLDGVPAAAGLPRALLHRPPEHRVEGLAPKSGLPPRRPGKKSGHETDGLDA